MKTFAYMFGFIIALALVMTTGGTILIPVAIVLVLVWLFGGKPGKSASGTGGRPADPGRKSSVGPAPGPKVCSHCGGENEPGAAYCERCGHRLS